MATIPVVERLGRFVWLTLREVALDRYKLWIDIARHLRDCFLVTSANDRSQLAAADEAAVRAVEKLLLDRWACHLPAGVPLPPWAGELVRGLVESLRDVVAEGNEGEQVRGLGNSLTVRLLRGSGALPPPDLSARQLAIGPLVVSAALRATLPPTSGGECPAVGDYDFKWFLRQGGFGRVYLAYHRPSGQLRAVKVGEVTDHRRLERELSAARAFDSPHLVRYLDAGGHDGRYWIAMEYLSEQTLADMLRDAPRDPSDPWAVQERAVRIGEQILLGLVALHEAGWIHRDLTPNNILADPSFHLRLTDFGLAIPIDGGDRLTTRGGTPGTVQYMSPEQLREEHLTPATDLYSFGVILHELFTGHRVHDKTTRVAAWEAISRTPPDLDRPDVPEKFRGLLADLLRLTKRPDSATEVLGRFQSAANAVLARLRFERDKDGWVRLLQARAIETFVEESDDELLDESEAAAEAFARRARAKHGVEKIDVPRVAEVLRAAVGRRAAVCDARRNLADAEARAAELARAPRDQRREASAAVRRTADELHDAQDEMRKAVHAHLRAEVGEWVEKQKDATIRLRRRRLIEFAGILGVVAALAVALTCAFTPMWSRRVGPHEAEVEAARLRVAATELKVASEQRAQGLGWWGRMRAPVDPRVPASMSAVADAERRVSEAARPFYNLAFFFGILLLAPVIWCGARVVWPPEPDAPAAD
jgi:hypothetical protein